MLGELKQLVKRTVEKLPLSLHNYASILREALC
jgi:hypothetical protein